jgi:hypothetical protein
MKINWKNVEFWTVITVSISVWMYVTLRMVVEKVYMW